MKFYLKNLDIRQVDDGATLSVAVNDETIITYKLLLEELSQFVKLLKIKASEKKSKYTITIPIDDKITITKNVQKKDLLLLIIDIDKILNQ